MVQAELPVKEAPPRVGTRALRILMVADVDPVHVIGGAERILNDHVRALAGRGHRVVTLCRASDPKLPAEESYCGARVVRHPVREGSSLSFTRSVLREGRAACERLLREEQFDLAYVAQPLAACSVLEPVTRAGLPVLYTFHSPWAEEYRVRQQARGGENAGPLRRAWEAFNARARWRMEHRALVRSDRVMVLSEFAAGQLRDLHGISRDRVSIIFGGVDLEKFRPPADRPALRRELGLPEGPLLITVRNLEPRMGLDSLIAAMRRVVRELPDAHLYIGGSGALKPRLAEQVEQLGLQEHVRFTGFIPEARLPDYYGAADVFVLPTRCLEGFGLVTVEALACGTPALGTPVGGTQEIMRRLDPRFLFAGTEPGQLADGILEALPRIVGNEALRTRCRRHVEDTYAWSVLAPQIEELMWQIVSARR